MYILVFVSHSIRLNMSKYTCKFNTHMIESSVSNCIECNVNEWISTKSCNTYN